MALIGTLAKVAAAAAPVVKKAAETAKKTGTATGGGSAQKTTTTTKTTATATGSSSSSGSSGGYKTYVKGADPELDGKIAVYSKAYADARAAGDARGMREANDRANQLRNQYGYAATFADEDIRKVADAAPKPSDGGAVTGGGTVVPGRRESAGAVPSITLPDRPQFSTATGGGGATSPVFDAKIQAPEVQKATDYSELIQSFQTAATEKALAELKAAYDKNVGAIDRAKGEIAPQYEEARNQAAARSALQRQGWQEQAAAMGLSSGAAGQAELARQNALQGSLTTLDKQESADLATLEFQRAQAETDYNNAIAQAKAAGDYELAQRLYQEKVRVDEANRQAIAQQWQQQLSALQFNYGVGKDQLSQQNWERQYGDSMAQQDYENQLSALRLQQQLQQQAWENQFAEGQYADSMAQQAWQNQLTQDQLEEQRQEAERERLWTLAAAQADYGDFSGFSALGLTPEAIANMRSVWGQDRDLALKQAQLQLQAGQLGVQQDQLAIQKAQQALAGGTTSGGRGSSSGGSSGSGRGTSSGTGSAGKWDGVDAWVGKYGQDAAEDYIKENYKALGYSSQSAALAGWRNHQREVGPTAGPGMSLQNFAALRQTLGRYRNAGEIDRARSMIMGVMDQLSEDQATEVYNLLNNWGM